MSRHGLSARVRRARVALLTGLGSYAALTIGLNLSLDTFATHWRDPEYGHRIKQLKPLIHKSSRTEIVVVLGSSRSQMGFNPAELGLSDNSNTLVYNLSQAGCGPPQQYMNLQRLLADGIRPTRLLVEILPPVMANRGPIEKSFIIDRLSYADVQNIAQYCVDPEAVRWEWLQKRANPWHMTRLSIVSHSSPNWLRWQSRQDFLWQQIKPFGWMPYFHDSISAEKRSDGLEQAKQQYLPYFPNFIIAPKPRQAHEDLTRIAKLNGIQVAFYTMPESPTFRNWYPGDVTASLQSYYQELEAQGMPVFQCSTWLNSDFDFADGHHLMKTGSKQFSQRFGAECLKPWLNSK